MFTGIIEKVGVIEKVEKKALSSLITVKSCGFFKDFLIGSSVAINGVCLTVIKSDEDRAQFDVISQTLSLTNLAFLQMGSTVNLERPLKFNGQVDGHLVQGHIDGLGKVLKVDAMLLEVSFDARLSTYIVAQGSIALDGISLTVAKLKNFSLEVALIPTTANKTNLKDRKEGEFINIEVDLISKYVEKQMESQKRYQEVM